MRPVRDPRLTGALTVMAAFGLHQARYALAPVQAADGSHSYLQVAPQLLAGALSLSIGLALVRVVRSPGLTSRRRPGAAAWLWCTLALLVILASQELLEGHRAMLAGHGGWIAVPLAACFGLALSRVLGAAQQAIAWVAETFLWGTRPVRRGGITQAMDRTATTVGRVRAADAGFPAAGRAPPVLTR